MRTHMFLAVLALSASAFPVHDARATTQNMTGLPTETQSRLAQDDSDNVPWDALGLLGLIGLFGLRRPHSDDSYHPSPVD